MPKFDRLDWFKFYPNDFLADSATSAMDPAALGGYALLLCHAFNSNPPGYLPDDDELLARLSRLNGHWPEYKAQVMRAFESRGGRWVQKRMAADHVAASRRYARAVAGGKATQKMLRDKRLQRVASTELKLPSSYPPSLDMQPVPEPDTSGNPSNLFGDNDIVRVASASREVVRRYKHKPSSARAELSEWTEAFETLFWPKYREWRSVGKAEALKAWLKIPGKGQELFDRIDAGLDAQIAQWKRDGTEERYRKHASSWLNQQRWLDVEVA